MLSDDALAGLHSSRHHRGCTPVVMHLCGVAASAHTLNGIPDEIDTVTFDTNDIIINGHMYLCHTQSCLQ